LDPTQIDFEAFSEAPSTTVKKTVFAMAPRAAEFVGQSAPASLS